MPSMNPRLLPARGDLAAALLRGLVEADRFVEGRRVRVADAVLDLRRHPRGDAALDTQLLHGETALLFEDDEGWAWIQAESDGYVGYAPSSGLAAAALAPSHRVAVARTFVYVAADIKSAVETALPLAAQVTVAGETGPFARLDEGGYVWRGHLEALRMSEGRDGRDLARVADGLVGTPYLWGGRTPAGLDCSGLVQLSFAMAGVRMPRDASMQEEVGRALAGADDLQRGDLVFWPGHVAIMLDAQQLVHASGHEMLVCREPLAMARRRIADGPAGKQISSIRRHYKER